MIKSSYPVIKTKKIEETSKFYEQFFGYTRSFSSDWYISLKCGSTELAILEPSHSTLPEKFRGETSPQSMLINFETDNVDEIYAEFKKANKPIHLELRDEPFGQRHFISEDPNGIAIDVIKNIPPSEEFLKQYSQ